jgi:hypothetical protein
MARRVLVARAKDGTAGYGIDEAAAGKTGSNRFVLLPRFQNGYVTFRPN